VDETENEKPFPVVELPLHVESPKAAIRFLVAELVRVGCVSAERAPEIKHAVWQREQLGSTTIGNGVAMPHAQLASVSETIAIIGRATQPINWPGGLGGPVNLVCLIVVKTGSMGNVCRAVEQVARQIGLDRPPTE
jgi:mannitol/fructose-specific phosphotransferase system IIA component (Ntr-type)